MKILNFYIGRQFLSTCLLSVAVLTFVMLSANLVRVFELLARGIPVAVLLEFLAYLLPVMLSFTIPMAVLCASVLVFSRFSADHEITAMRASGIGVWQIVTPSLLTGIVLSALCVYLHLNLAPNCKYRADQLRMQEAVRNPLAFLEAGRFVELPGYIIFVEKREQNRLQEVHIYGLNARGKVSQDITARHGTVALDEANGQLLLTLENAIIASGNSASGDSNVQLQRLSGQSVTIPIQFGDKQNAKPLFRKIKYMDLKAISGCIYLYSERGVDVTPLYVELHRRLSMSLSPLAFVLLGIPFGIRTRRNETSVGLVVCLLLVLVFYVFLILADSLKSQPQFHPELLVWLPNILYQVGGLAGLVRIAKR